jgi:Mg2+ and Co2+ transporter CorA
MSSPTHHVNFDLETGQSPRPVTAASHSQHDSATSIHSESGAPKNPIPQAPILKRRQTRATTTLSFKAVDASRSRKDWHPGQEPGLDPSKPNGGRPQTPTLHEECQITVVDFSEEDMVMHDFDNAGLISFLNKKQEDWISCRWINVNGLSWDVIQALGKHKKLHRLAIEDMTNTKNRTKADW